MLRKCCLAISLLLISTDSYSKSEEKLEYIELKKNPFWMNLVANETLRIGEKIVFNNQDAYRKDHIILVRIGDDSFRLYEIVFDGQSRF